ncbi:hypothetical protein [Halalkalibacter krulwichiae]|uniref:Uncharacterized protein n=1 Tax=Halalkalibacter krulwichiae TaxID=199441 RepID=A0A1X9MM66_9BACI|nr:hypothetical protein [Halalkalibacter krulwichiae]ARK32172.1 hypothetical protein BkAM31D_21265 [Halalkalibacter krulwichiae]
MDRRTFAYMADRVEKYRAVTNEILKLEKRLEQVIDGKSLKCVRLAIESSNIDVTPWGFEGLKDVYEARVEAEMINAFVDVTKAEIKRLENLRAEI